MLIPRSQKIKYFGWWTWKTLHVGKSNLSSISPKEISFEISGRTWCYSSKIDLFITIAPEKFRSKYLNIAPNCVQRGNLLYTRGSISSRKVVLLSTTPLVVVGGFWNGRNSLSCSLLVYRLVEIYEISRSRGGRLFFIKGKTSIKTFLKGNGRAQRGKKL